MITINGTTVSPNPSEFSVDIMDITEGVRNGNGDGIFDRINTKRKMSLGWKYLSNSELSTLLNLFTSSFMVTVIYPDPLTGNNRTGTFYPGDRSNGAFKYSGGSVTGWIGTKFNLIEV